jgi:hypothetical protein
MNQLEEVYILFAASSSIFFAGIFLTTVVCFFYPFLVGSVLHFFQIITFLLLSFSFLLVLFFGLPPILLGWVFGKRFHNTKHHNKKQCQKVFIYLFIY